jgi:beta-glucosidase
MVMMHAQRFRASCVVAFLTGAACVVQAGGEVAGAYRDASLSVEERVGDLLGRMTLEEKIRQTHMFRANLLAKDKRSALEGAPLSPERMRAVLGRAGIGAHSYRPYSASYINAFQKIAREETRLGIPVMIFAEGLHGYQGTCYPQMLAQAASFDTNLVRRIYEAVGAEARAFGVHALHGPVLDLARDARWGRSEETFGEDTHLASRMAVAAVRGLQKDGQLTRPDAVIADVKHLAGHSPPQGGINMGPVSLGRRELFTDYLSVFKAAFQEGGARMTMAAYHELDGVPCVANRWLLTEVLREQWGFNGVVISDCNAVIRLLDRESVSHATAESEEDAVAQALNAGLSCSFLEFGSDPEGDDRWPGIVQRAVEQGRLSERVIDRAASDMLRLKFELGLFENPFTATNLQGLAVGTRENAALALQAAREAMTLLQNRGNLLPLSISVARLAVIGPQRGTQTGDYAPFRYGPSTGILDSIRAAVSPETVVTYVQGVPIKHRFPEATMPGEFFRPPEGGEQGLLAEYFTNRNLSGAPALTRIDRAVDFDWNDQSPDAVIPADEFSARWTGRFTSPADWEGVVGVEATDGVRLWVDDRLLIDDWREGPVARQAPCRFEGGRAYAIKLEYFQAANPKAIVRLLWNRDPSGGIPEAVAAARAADVAILVVGEDGRTSGENYDRSGVDLPGRQRELIEAVVKTGTPCVMVVLNGRALALPWEAEHVPAILVGWFPGEAGGQAVADVLFGAYNPAGRLPVTFPRATGQLPLYYGQKRTASHPNARKYAGDEPVMDRSPLFPFGHGLSYTAFTYSDLHVEPEAIPAGGKLRVQCVVRNSGAVAGDEVVQLYLRDVISSVTTPDRSLKGFQRMHLDPGESRAAVFELGPEQLQLLDRNWEWRVEPGEFRVMIGASSDDIRLQGAFRVQGEN